MAEKTMYISQQQTKPIKILKWKVSEGNTISVGRIVLLYNFEGAAKSEQRKLKVSQAGTVHRILVQEGAIAKPGETLLELKECTHPTIMNDMCAECGSDLRKNDVAATASVPMVHAIPNLKVSEETARKLGKADSDRLIKDRKLALLVDLDQTLIHTTNDNIQANIKDIYHFQLYGPSSPWYHTRLRPGTHHFLNNIFPYFELHICTFGARNYAHTIAMFLDGEQKLFSNRILSRDECFDPSSKKANLKALFPCGDNMVCIIDDREDVWSNATNLIHVKPYHFFQHTGDIHAPPGLDKHENDNKGVDLTKIKKLTAEEETPTSTEEKNEKKKTEMNGDKHEVNGEENVQKEPSGKETAPNAKVEQVGKSQSDGEADGKANENNEAISNNVNSSSSDEKKTGGNTDATPVEKEENDKGGHEKENGNQSKPEEQSTKPEESSKPDEEPTKPDEEPSKPVEEPSKPVEEPSKPVEEPSKPSEDSSKPSEESDKEPSKPDEGQGNNSIGVAASTEIGSSEEGKNADAEHKSRDVTDGTPNNGENKEQINNNQNANMIDVEDPDDYLMYLEDILKRIHKAFYENYDKMESGEVPDLKEVIPTVRSRVLKGCHLVFSGLVPTHSRLEASRAYLIARSLGATVSQEMEDDSTHLVAVRPGTAKVNLGRRKKHLKIVTPDWLWCCAERWEHVSEKLFPLNSKGSKNRHPPPHCSSPEHVTTYPEHSTPALRKRTPSGRFMDTINPLMSFSSADIADMDKEVDHILDDESDSSSNEGGSKKPSKKPRVAVEKQPSSSSSSSSDESLTAEFPKGYKRKRQQDLEEMAEEEFNNTTEDDEMPSTKFRRGERVGDELDIGDKDDDDSQDSEGSIEPPDEVDDREWNMMGAALEREFLSND